MFLGAIIPLSFERKLYFLRDSHVCSLMPAEGYLSLRPCPKKRKKEHLARRVASGVFQGFRSVSGTVHTLVKKKRFYRGGPPPARPEGLSGSRGSFYVKSQIQVVFPIARQTPGPVTRGQRPTFRDHNSLCLSSARKHRRPSAGPRWKVSGRQTTQISSVSEKDKV